MIRRAVSAFLFLAILVVEAEAMDFPALFKSASDSLNDWQVDEASEIADKALVAARKNPEELGYAYFLKAQTEFYRGDYRAVGEFAEKARALIPASADSLQFLDFMLDVSRRGEGFIEAKFPRFHIRYAHPMDKILVKSANDALERAYSEIGRELNFHPEGKIIVEIYPDKESFTAASTLSDRDIRTTGVVGICKFNRIMILSPRLLPKGYGWLDTLAHEYVHYLVFQKAGGAVPVWVHEGIAKFYEKLRREGDKSVMTPFYETLLARALKTKTLVPIEKMHPSLGKLESAEEAQLAFAEVATMIEFLVKRRGSGAISALLDALGETEGDYKAAIKKAAKMDFQRFLALWEADLRARKLKERIPNLRVRELKIEEGTESQEKGKGSREIAELADGRARDHARLGDMLRERGRLKAAAFEYEKASRFAPLSAVIVNRLASAESGIGEFDKAEARLAGLLEFYPEYVDTHKNLGEIYIRKKFWDKARSSLEEAAAINPFDPEIRIALASVYGKLGLADSEREERGAISILLRGGDSE